MDDELFETVKDLLAKAAAQEIAMQIIVAGLDSAKSGLKEKVVAALHDAARQSSRNSEMQDVTAELQHLALLLK
ncbi:hypothetical protein [Primorskyibacter sp. 2E233]|uniref:hypothetical protein n=1 Tax=Primorskyibacter sp. 2E233 TaxID=3413431 RepID=UPI003BF33904